MNDVGGPLTGREIRLLEVYPPKGDTDTLECRRLRISLSAADRPQYEALSYVWGDPKICVEIICDGVPFQVTVNLFNALRKLRLPCTSRLVWADAICIDQNNDDEKNCQIPLMNEIYSLAESVVVWLGEVDMKTSEKVAGLVEDLMGLITEAKHRGLDSDDLPEAYRIVIPATPFANAIRQYLPILYDMTWFTRIWCVQEVVLARNAIMMLGGSQLKWEDVGSVAEWLSDVEPLRGLDYDANAFYGEVSVWGASTMYGMQKKPQNLFELLGSCSAFEATDRRDKVYGILALVEPKTEAQAVTISCKSSAEDIFANIIVVMIRLYSDLRAFEQIDHGNEYHRGNGNLPSWAIEWDYFEYIRAIPHDSSTLSACKDVEAKLQDDALELDSKHLRLKGIFYSNVTNTHVIMSQEDTLKSNSNHPFLESFDAIVARKATDFANQLQLSNVLARTLTAGATTNDPYPIADASPEQQFAFITSFLRLIESLKAGVDYMAFGQNLPSWDEFLEEAEHVCTGRRVFETANGNFGLGPAAMRSGDIVVVLYGGQSPYVLRPYGDNFFLIGQAYVDELMHGKLIDDLEAGLAQEREFCLV
ncbi:heterokaryon incompatibility protein [Stemphylium lycopersici]|uniref:HET-domain-containing protein n=1 Tax=Stemphylium lycopersici TaxID=183478 RepID=A0A364MUP5_STELY|nr:heterokaryon incompatibility protein [Stemphylium lycopersici]RAR04035.1 HET-domain-containing protein [Stemphylium lycopersici]